jgi:hypothetical protein
MSIKEFARATGIPESELLGRSRAKRLDNARQLLWLRLREKGYTTTWIAKLFNRDHSCIVTGTKTIKNLIETGDPLVMEWYKKTGNTTTMSKRKDVIVIDPPKLFLKNRTMETYSIKGFECPNCQGRGHFMPREIGKDEYEEVPCEACFGTGRLRADIIIQWCAESDNSKD